MGRRLAWRAGALGPARSALGSPVRSPVRSPVQSPLAARRALLLGACAGAQQGPAPERGGLRLLGEQRLAGASLRRHRRRWPVRHRLRCAQRHLGHGQRRPLGVLPGALLHRHARLRQPRFHGAAAGTSPCYASPTAASFPIAASRRRGGRCPTSSRSDRSRRRQPVDRQRGRLRGARESRAAARRATAARCRASKARPCSTCAAAPAPARRDNGLRRPDVRARRPFAVGVDGRPAVAGRPGAGARRGSVTRLTQFTRAGGVLRGGLPARRAARHTGRRPSAVNGVSEITAVDDDHLLTLERAAVRQPDGRYLMSLRLYELDLREASDIRALPALQGAATGRCASGWCSTCRSCRWRGWTTGGHGLGTARGRRLRHRLYWSPTTTSTRPGDAVAGLRCTAGQRTVPRRRTGCTALAPAIRASGHRRGRPARPANFAAGRANVGAAAVPAQRHARIVLVHCAPPACRPTPKGPR